MDARARFATEVAQQTVRALAVSRQTPVPAIYGVWLENHSHPIYIGQTGNAARRLWDLPVGESHHLSNTFPPETWGRIVVLKWADLLAHCDTDFPLLLASVQKEFRLGKLSSTAAVGLGLEHRFQTAFKPLFNLRRKTRQGTTRTVNLAQSQAVGAQIAALLDREFNRVVMHWNQLVGSVSTGETFQTPFGCVVYPHLIWGHNLFSSPRPPPATQLADAGDEGPGDIAPQK